jgi:hypothetical protein
MLTTPYDLFLGILRREKYAMDDLYLERAQWRKSSYSSASGACVEVTRNLPGIVAVRDSKNPKGPRLIIASDEWRALLASIKAHQEF